MIPWTFHDDISNSSGVIVLTDKQTDKQTDTTENNTTLDVRMVTSISIIIVTSVTTASKLLYLQLFSRAFHRFISCSIQWYFHNNNEDENELLLDICENIEILPSDEPELNENETITRELTKLDRNF